MENQKKDKIKKYPLVFKYLAINSFLAKRQAAINV